MMLIADADAAISRYGRFPRSRFLAAPHGAAWSFALTFLAADIF